MKNIAKIISIAKPLYKSASLIMVLIVVTAILQQVTPILSKFIVDEIVNQVSYENGSIEKLYYLIGISFSINILSAALSSISQRLGDDFAGKLRKYLTKKFYRKVLTLPQTYFDSQISGEIVNQLNRGIEVIRGFANTSTNFIIPTFLQSLLTIAILAYYNMPTAIFTFLLFPVYFFLTLYSTKKWGKEEEKKNKLKDIGRGRIQEAISNIKVLKAFSNEYNELSFITKKQTQINKVFATQSRAYHIFDFIRNLSLNIILLGINIVVFYSTFQGNMSMGVMTLIIQMVMLARRPLFAMSFILTQVQTAESGSKEFFKILELKSTESLNLTKKLEKINNPHISFNNVSFNYKDTKSVLKNISFDIKPNEKIALVGHSGAGKSTIVNLLLKLYEPTRGDIYLNDASYQELDHFQIRHNISLVFQDNELFSSTVKENVVYGTKANDKAIIRALKLSNAYDFVKALKNGINTKIGERGIKLSGGQKQRIQIARAILSDSPILILDEATSSLDSISEREVQKGINNLMKNKLVIIIAHRLSTVQNVDRIFVLDKGQIVDEGSPKELAQNKGVYSDLLKYQIAGNKKLLKNFEIY